MRLDTLRSDPMSLEEAARIRANFDRGALDPRLPGTMELVSEARRRSDSATLDTRQAAHSGRRARWLVAGCCMAIPVVSFVLALFFLSHAS